MGDGRTDGLKRLAGDNGQPRRLPERASDDGAIRSSVASAAAASTSAVSSSSAHRNGQCERTLLPDSTVASVQFALLLRSRYTPRYVHRVTEFTNAHAAPSLSLSLSVCLFPFRARKSRFVDKNSLASTQGLVGRPLDDLRPFAVRHAGPSTC